MKEPMLAQVENAIHAAISLSLDTSISDDELRTSAKAATGAALAALRTPTEGMVQAVPSDRNTPIYAEDIWEAMIEAAMQGG